MLTPSSKIKTLLLHTIYMYLKSKAYESLSQKRVLSTSSIICMDPYEAIRKENFV